MMKEDFRGIGCSIRLYGGMNTKGYSDHDIDVNITMRRSVTAKQLESKCQKWSRLFRQKHGLSLDARVLTIDKNYIYDYYGSVGICDADKPTSPNENLNG